MSYLSDLTITTVLYYVISGICIGLYCIQIVGCRYCYRQISSRLYIFVITSSSMRPNPVGLKLFEQRLHTYFVASLFSSTLKFSMTTLIISSCSLFELNKFLYIASLSLLSAFITSDCIDL